MTQRAHKFHGHSSMSHALDSLPVATATRQAVATELRFAIRAIDVARPGYESTLGTEEN